MAKITRRGKAGKTVSASKKTAGNGSAAPTDSKRTQKGRFTKRYLKARPVCKVTFRLPAEAVPAECAVHIAGDFNGWDLGATPMNRLKRGDYTVTVDLPRDREYRYRYFIDGCRWENDWSADRYDPNPYGWFDSVVVV
jgi:1,4-alpha-glucan branching enzyme